MKKTNILAICVIFLVVLMLCSGCSSVLQLAENTELRQQTETMLDALISNDFDAAYSLVKHLTTKEDFKPTFTQMQALLNGAGGYELKMLSVHTNTSVSNGEKRSVVSSVYEMTYESGKLIINVRTVDQTGLDTFYLTPYEKTDYYYTGTPDHMDGATPVQWVFLLLNVIAIGLAVFALVDCCRHRIKKKVLWILLLVLGFFSVAFTISPTGFRLHFNLGWISAYSAFIRYGSGAVTLRLMLPISTLIYFIKRRSLLKAPAPTVTAPENEPAPLAESSADQPSTQAPENDCP